VHAWLQSDFGRATIADLAAQGVEMELHRARGLSNALEGKTFVVTGTLSKYKREEIEALIQQHGGRASSSVSKKTSYVVAGAEAGSKLAKAQQLGVPVLSEADFDRLIGAGA
jgi:DNA ligase (NAD+)